MNYSVTNDKRKVLESYLFALGCLFCVILEIFVFPLLIIEDKTLNVLYTIFKILFSVSPVVFVLFIKKLFGKTLLRLVGVPDLSGSYNVEIQSSYKGGTISKARIIIKQTFDSIMINFKAEQSISTASSCHIDNSKLEIQLVYTYLNDGNAIDNKNKTHVGTAVLFFDENKKIDGYYYNNGKDRSTYGKIAS
jgi:hypothetical protein